MADSRSTTIVATAISAGVSSVLAGRAHSDAVLTVLGGSCEIVVRDAFTEHKLSVNGQGPGLVASECWRYSGKQSDPQYRRDIYIHQCKCSSWSVPLEHTE